MCEGRIAWLALVITAAAGCGGGPVPVRGRVLLDDVPVPGATVLLVPEQGGHPANGRTDANGVFRLTTFKPNDGALPGRYTVVVTKTEAIPPPPTAEPGNAESVNKHYEALKATRTKKKPPLPEVYGDSSRTPLRCTIPPDGDLDLPLQSKAK